MANDLKSTYNYIAEDWVKDHAKDDWWQPGTDKFLSFLKPGATVLDVGCGGGIKSAYMQQKGFVVTGMDFSEKMIEIAKREYPGPNFMVGDVYELEKIPGTFDGVFAQAVLLHIPKARALEVLTKMRDKLNPGGILYVGVKGVKAEGAEEESVTESDYGYEYERFFSYFSPAELRDYISKLGMLLCWDGIASSGRTEWVQIIGQQPE
jgi:SAM-dependent methyltransferase